MLATHVSSGPIKFGKAALHARRELAAEAAVAIVVNGSTQAVMMATPADLEAFGIGFALTERIVASPAEIERIAVVEHDLGIEVQLWVVEARARHLAQRRRTMAGPSGCGLCGIESLEQAMRGATQVGTGIRLTAAQVHAAMAALTPAQSLNAVTHAVHAAALWHPAQGLLAICEDVGRHNALDKLVGTTVQDHLEPEHCALLLTSRISIEMIQKAAILGTATVIAVSAPTALAVTIAEAAGITLIGVARRDGFEVFSHPARVDCGFAPNSPLRRHLRSSPD
jgi:FdhD protein